MKELTETTRHRKHLDTSVELISTVLFGPTTNVLKSVREPGLPLVDDWECLKSVVRVSQSFKLLFFVFVQYIYKFLFYTCYLTDNNVKRVCL